MIKVISMARVANKVRGIYLRFYGDRKTNNDVDPARFTYSREEWEENSRCVHAARPQILSARIRVNWFLLPYLSHPMGGIGTVYRLATHMAQTYGVKNTFVYCHTPSFTAEKARLFLGPLIEKANIEHICIGTETSGWRDSIPPCDIAIATRWDTAYPVLRFAKTQAKWYLIQDFDPGFYPAGVTRSLSEHTYSFGFTGIANSSFLAEKYQAWGNKSAYFLPSIDRELYAYMKRSSDPNDVVRIFFYARPGVVQNGFELGISALRELKKTYGDRIEIMTAGRDWDEKKYGLEGVVTNLGLLTDMKEVAALYQSCHIGLVFIFTEGFPLVTLECMSTGAAMVVNTNKAHVNLWQQYDAVEDVTPILQDVVSKISKLVDQPRRREQLVANSQIFLDELDRQRLQGRADTSVLAQLLEK